MPANGSSDREMNKAECWGRAIKEEGKSPKGGGGGCKDKPRCIRNEGSVLCVPASQNRVSIKSKELQ